MGQSSIKSPNGPRPRPTGRWRFSLRTLLLGMSLTAALLAGWLARDYLPGTIRRTPNGFPRGTGAERYYYPNGALKVEEYYRNGLLVSATWYRPDGSRVASSEFDVQRGGDGYYLRDDGTIKKKVHYKYHADQDGPIYVADGPATDYRPDGTVERRLVYRDGQEVASQPGP